LPEPPDARWAADAATKHAWPFQEWPSEAIEVEISSFNYRLLRVARDLVLADVKAKSSGISSRRNSIVPSLVSARRSMRIPPRRSRGDQQTENDHMNQDEYKALTQEGIAEAYKTVGEYRVRRKPGVVVRFWVDERTDGRFSVRQRHGIQTPRQAGAYSSSTRFRQCPKQSSTVPSAAC
jgi:hypothetical protein